MGELHGVLVVDKPAGKTSAQVVAIVKRRLEARKVGHTGTLDPMATGVLPIVIGRGTKVASHLLADDKQYRATVMLGVRTDTLDADGTITSEDRAAAREVTADAVTHAARRFLGEIRQIPPMVSALRHKGRRLHQLAREGKTVERPARKVTVHRLEIHSYQPPVIEMFIHCSKGTYVRAIARDLGQALDVGAHLTALRRTASGSFTEDQALPLEQLDRECAVRHLISVEDAVAHLPAIRPPAEHLRRIAQGLPRWASEVAPDMPEGLPFQCLTPSGRLLALARVRDGDVRYDHVFTDAWTGETKG